MCGCGRVEDGRTGGILIFHGGNLIGRIGTGVLFRDMEGNMP